MIPPANPDETYLRLTATQTGNTYPKTIRGNNLLFRRLWGYRYDLVYGMGRHILVVVATRQRRSKDPLSNSCLAVGVERYRVLGLKAYRA